ncbi:hypothetical protein ACERK3_19115 [Phycisphaerales bacterium AB-hyl4]|uniref:Immunity protein 49 of polymorphic toxin system n=1 Tax=Natronomicrosphaera hydrolytica TaxID=3242702 RepID=A0ABV4UBM0_9BACT
MSDAIPDTPTFEEWVHYCFTQGYRDFHEDFKGSDHDACAERETRFLGFDSSVLADYIVRLFGNSDSLADGYTDDQIADGVWFIFGVASSYFHVVRDKVDKPMQVACIKSVESLYLRLFDRICCKRGSDPDGDYINTLKVDIAVHMIWDMDCIEGAVMFKDQYPHLVQPGLMVLENIALKSRTSTCMMSALHGLGHIQHYHPQACKRIIDRFLKMRKAPDWVREYAVQACTGQVM